MAPKKAGAQKAAAPKVYDYSDLEKGIKLQVNSEGTWYAAEVVTVSKAKAKSKAPVKVSYVGYEGYDEWVGGDRLRSKALKVAKKEETKPERAPLEFEFGYWGIRGLGAVFRMMFEYKGAKYKDNQYTTGEDWFKGDKPKILEKNPLANLPYVTCGNDTICQTNACLSYLGSRLRMSGGGYKARQMNEQLLCEIYDVRNTMIDMVYPFKEVCRTEEEHKAKVVKVLEGGPFKKFEAILEKGDTEYFCGKTPCTSDFHIWEMLDQHKMLAEKHGQPDIFTSIPKCKAFYDRFRALPQLQKYFDSDAYKLPVNNQGAGAYFA
eukprot:TRINITY_DN1425_c0_g1_i3.p1 TRINITY_DN1425_c0_g1~~TRINITY_DN1425_c0_g1_i3.p1  ORF type:complete len:320 (+),score=71.46 TRINITY_DN1425_c0_g1_i3:62-1021(+)